MITEAQLLLLMAITSAVGVFIGWQVHNRCFGAFRCAICKNWLRPRDPYFYERLPNGRADMNAILCADCYRRQETYE